VLGQVSARPGVIFLAGVEKLGNQLNIAIFLFSFHLFDYSLSFSFPNRTASK
jgi:hypothetical protein